MPENPTIREIMDRLETYIENSKNTHNLFIPPLWVSEAQVLLDTLKSNEWILGE